MSTGPSPAPSSTSPCSTARDAAAAAPRAASTSDSPRASSAASVAECVQPAPCVAATSCRATGISTCVVAVEEMVDRGVAVPAGDDRPRPRRARAAAPRARARGASTPGERLRLHQVRRHDRRERKEPRDERIDGIVLEQLRAGARDHHGVDDERNADAARDSPRPSRSARARRASPSSRRRRRGRRRRRRAAARTNAGGSSWIAVTPTVFWAVSATSTDMPCAPAAANAFRSAWMPAPPPESEVAIVSARGTGQILLPSPVLTGSGSTGVISAAPARHPGVVRLAVHHS